MNEFKQLYGRLFPRVVQHLRNSGFRGRAEDLAQETFRRVYERMSQTAQQPIENLEAFLWSAVRNQALNEIRRRNADKRSVDEVSLDALVFLPEESSRDPFSGEEPLSAEEKAIEEEIEQLKKEQLIHAIQNLPPGQRDALTLRLADLSYKEIAKALGISVNAVKGRIRDSVKSLLKRIP